MTDLELLKMTAKAVGLFTPEFESTELGKYWVPAYGFWNPLTDNGDALQIAVKLRLAVYTAIDNGRPPMYAAAWSGGYPNTIRCEEKHDSDPYAATRRAIVRAAAEIGKGME